jgi:acyl-CoA synthetase (AMP-forming)/AMP-acid ligase II
VIPTTLLDVLESNRTKEGSVCFITGENAERRVNHREAHARALGILHHLQALGARQGDRVILFLQSNEQFIDAFWAAICGGLVPVPLAVGINDEHRRKVLRVARKLGHPFLYTDGKNLARLGELAQELGEARQFGALKSRCFLVESLTDISRPGKVHRPAPEDLALIQFSSGSTSEPKGVMLSHRNLLANSAGVAAVGKFSEADVSLSWMPLTHDMGLIGFYLMQFANQVHVNLMQTDLFVRRPLLWLQLAAKKRVTITCSPNFGYRHFLKVLGTRRLDGIDLSAIRLIYNGAEPISVQLCDEFLERLAHTGLKREAMYPVYGLAEASLAVTLPAPGTAYRAIRVDRRRLKVGDETVEPGKGRDALALMGLGRPVPGLELRIVDAAGAPLADGRVGHVAIRGSSVTRGYYEDPEATRRAIDADGWLATGDIGLLQGGDLYLTGRSKEIIIINGQNYFPHDLERIAEPAAGLELGKIVVSAVARRSHGPARATVSADATATATTNATASASATPADATATTTTTATTATTTTTTTTTDVSTTSATTADDAGADEQLIAFVLHRGGLDEFTPTVVAVGRLINEHTGLEVARVIPVKRIPKTTSGKVQRYLLAEAFENGEFDADLAVVDAHLGAQRAPGLAQSMGLEARLLELCERALNGKTLDVGDNLFEIGANSLKLIEIHQSIEQIFPGQLELTEIFEHPTIARLARHLEDKLAAAQAGAVPSGPTHRPRSCPPGRVPAT